MLDEQIARKMFSVSQTIADGYRRNISESSTDQENEIARQCAIAASNTGYFTLKAFGYSHEDIIALGQ